MVGSSTSCLNALDAISVLWMLWGFDDDTGVDMFLEITKEDITARGKPDL